MSRLPPKVDELDVVDQQWQLAVEPHRDLLVDVTGIDPVDDLDLQDLATITARLEGYVDAQKQRTEQGGQPAHPRSDDDDSILSWLAGLLATVLPDSMRDSTDPEPDPRESEASYDTERVYQLSRFFRAKLEAKRSDIQRGDEQRPSPVPAR